MSRAAVENKKEPSVSLLSPDLCAALGIDRNEIASGDMTVRSPIDGVPIAQIKSDDKKTVAAKIEKAQAAFLAWRSVPAPVRGELIRLFGEELRAHKQELGQLVTVEAGKILSEGQGEVQEMIDICDFAVGLSRQLYGLTIASERPNHRMMESWHPLGVIGVISAFNFPVAVWCWNFALAIICGDSVVWKPSEKTCTTALACQKIWEKTVVKFNAAHGNKAPKDLSVIIWGAREVGEALAANPLVPLISATGSTRMGKAVAPVVAARLGRSLLELGGNNAMIVAPSADMSLVLRAVLFAAVGTAGQRCTTLRRLLVHESVYDQLLPQLQKAYNSVRIGNPLEAATLLGPLIDEAAFTHMQQALEAAKKQGGKVQGGERLYADVYPRAYYVKPAIVEMPSQTAQVKEEVFAPILYVMKYKKFEEALALQNDVAQGLSSCIFTNDVREAESFVSAIGSDCGIANVNIGPSGAEIGGAFGGEKETGGGRESGSDSWRNYMRRATNTVNYGTTLPLAQGVKFDL
jgi:aldehyde dehydrogenase (NAD+)